MAPRLATQQGKGMSSKSTTSWDAYFEGASMWALLTRGSRHSLTGVLTGRGRLSRSDQRLAR
jgi:hypothetical protein